MPPAFSPGRGLSRRLYFEVIARQLADSPHAAALLGPGSDALGFDTEQSTDHDWGPRVQVLIPSGAMRPTLELPATFEGWPLGSVDVVVTEHLFHALLGFDPSEGVSLENWLITPSQTLRSVAVSVVHHDPDGDIRRRQALSRGTHTISGSSSWDANGGASHRKNTSWGGRRRSATSSGPRSSARASRAT